MNLQHMEELSSRVWSRLRPHTKRIAVAGSIRRGKEYPRDIEIVAEPHLNEDMFGDEATPILEPIERVLRSLGTLPKNGPRQKQLILDRPRVHVDIFLVHPPARWAPLFAIRTGPGTLSKMCVDNLRQHRGMRCLNGRIVSLFDHKEIDCPDEETFFRLCGFPCVKPSRRQELAHAVARGFYVPAVGKAAPRPFTGII